MSRIIRDLDSVLIYVVKVRGSSGWIGTVCNQSNMENGSSLHIVLPESALDSFTTMTERPCYSKSAEIQLYLMLPWYVPGINQKTLDILGFPPILSNRGELT